MKRVIIVHRWDGNPEADWYQWLKEELERMNVKVEILAMPHPERPEIRSWTDAIKKQVKNPDKETYFIGHSVGCQAILRYLQTLPENTRIGGCLLVAGWLKLNELETEEEREIAGPWFKDDINFNKIKKMGQITALFSDDDPFVPLNNKDMFENELDADVIVEKKMGHYNHYTAPTILKQMIKMLRLD